MALADKTRLRLLNLLNEDEVCVFYFTEVLQETQTKISRHLACLRRAKIVETRRAGKWIYYRLVNFEDENVERIFDELRRWMETDQQMQRDRERFSQICGRMEKTQTFGQNVFPKSDAVETNVKKSQHHYQRTPLAEFLL